MTKIVKRDLTNPAVVLEGFKPEGSNDYCPKLIGRAVAAVGNAGKKLDVLIHATACAIISRADLHSDASLMHVLANNMPRSSRRKALVAWFHHYTNFRMAVNKDGTYAPAKLLPADGKMFRENLPLGAFDKPFWTVEEKDTDPSAFDGNAFARAVASLIKRAEADNAKLDDAARAALADLKVVRQKLPA